MAFLFALLLTPFLAANSQNTLEAAPAEFGVTEIVIAPTGMGASSESIKNTPEYVTTIQPSGIVVATNAPVITSLSNVVVVEVQSSSVSPININSLLATFTVGLTAVNALVTALSHAPTTSSACQDKCLTPISQILPGLLNGTSATTSCTTSELNLLRTCASVCPGASTWDNAIKPCEQQLNNAANAKPLQTARMASINSANPKVEVWVLIAVILFGFL